MSINIEDAAHLLRRTSFGCTEAEAALLAGAVTDRAAAVEWVLNTHLNPPAIVPDFPGADATWERLEELRAAWLQTMASAPRPLLEKLVLFWHGHFAMRIEQPVPFLDREQLVTLRSHATGSFRDLLQSIAVLPEMLLFLNGFQNVSAAPNQNFARELMELYSLGVDQYSLLDVKETARAWTGHGFYVTGDARVVAYRFDAPRHDSGPKTIFGITKAWDGPQVIDEITTGVKADTSARFVVTKLWRHLVGTTPSSQALAAVVGTYRSAGLSTVALCRAILNQPEFWAPEARLNMVRPPVDWAVHVVRATGLSVNQFAEANGLSLARRLDDMGQALFRPASVAGWGEGNYWVSASTAWARASFAARVSDLTCPLDRPLDPSGFLHRTVGQSVPDAVTTALSAFGVISPTAATRAALEAWLSAVRAQPDPAAQHEAVRGLTELTILAPEVQMS